MLRLNPFEVREVSKLTRRRISATKTCLNPFEVREVSKPAREAFTDVFNRLNPFEVREVSKPYDTSEKKWLWVLIPLKSGKFLNAAC